MKVSKLADYGIVILNAMALNSHDRMSASALAVLTKLPEATVSKVLKLLAKSDFVQATRGVQGGYALVKEPCDISVEQIVRAIDGPIVIVSCVDTEEPDCSLARCCSVRGRWDRVNLAVRSALEMVSLADMMPSVANQAVRKTEKEEELYGRY